MTSPVSITRMPKQRRVIFGMRQVILGIYTYQSMMNAWTSADISTLGAARIELLYVIRHREIDT